MDNRLFLEKLGDVFGQLDQFLVDLGDESNSLDRSIIYENSISDSIDDKLLNEWKIKVRFITEAADEALEYIDSSEDEVYEKNNIVKKSLSDLVDSIPVILNLVRSCESFLEDSVSLYGNLYDLHDHIKAFAMKPSYH